MTETTDRTFTTECRYIYDCIQDDIDIAITQASDFMGEKHSFLRKLSVFLTPPLLCIFMYRLSHLFWIINFAGLARFIGWVNFVLHKASISPASEIAGGMYLPHTVGVLFHGSAGKNLTIFANADVTSNSINYEVSNQGEKYPVLGDNVMVGAWGSVIGGVMIGEHSKIAAYTFVSRDLPANSTAFRRLPKRQR